MAFEKEIAEATKICDKWIARSVKDMTTLMGIKKNGLAWEKDNIARIERLVAANEGKEALIAIKDGREWIAKYSDEAADIYKKHNEFVMGEPRAGTKGICAAIGLKDSKAAAYIAVTKAMEKELIKQTKQFKETESLYKDDIAKKVAVMLSKLDTLEKMGAGAQGKLTAYSQQFAKDSKAHLENMSKTMSILKPSMAEKMIQEIAKDKNKWVGGLAKNRQDQYQVVKARVENMPQVMALAEKNYNRVLKSLPAELHKQFLFAAPIKAFEKKQEEVRKEFKAIEAKFKMAMLTIANNFPEDAK